MEPTAWQVLTGNGRIALLGHLLDRIDRELDVRTVRTFFGWLLDN